MDLYWVAILSHLLILLERDKEVQLVILFKFQLLYCFKILRDDSAFQSHLFSKVTFLFDYWQDAYLCVANATFKHVLSLLFYEIAQMKKVYLLYFLFVNVLSKEVFANLGWNFSFATNLCFGFATILFKSPTRIRHLTYLCPFSHL